MPRYSDEELVREFQQARTGRRQKAFDHLYLRYAQPLTEYFFFALNRDYEEARDFVQDLFLKLLESPEKFNPDRRFKPWIYRVASNMCKNEFRRKEVITKYREHASYISPVSYETNAGDLRLRDGINRMTHEKRSLIILRFKLNFSIKEIADIYACPEGTVKSRLFYAVKELSKNYKK